MITDPTILSYEEQRDRLRQFLGSLEPGARVSYSDPSVPAEATCESVSGIKMDRRGRALVSRLLRRLRLERTEIEGGRGFVVMSLEDYHAHVYRKTCRVASAAVRAREVAETALRLPDLSQSEANTLRSYAAGMGLAEASMRGMFDPPPVKKLPMKLVR